MTKPESTSISVKDAQYAGKLVYEGLDPETATVADCEQAIKLLYLSFCRTSDLKRDDSRIIATPLFHSRRDFSGEMHVEFTLHQPAKPKPPNSEIVIEPIDGIPEFPLYPHNSPDKTDGYFLGLLGARLPKSFDSYRPGGLCCHTREMAISINQLARDFLTQEKYVPLMEFNQDLHHIGAAQRERAGIERA